MVIGLFLFNSVSSSIFLIDWINSRIGHRESEYRKKPPHSFALSILSVDVYIELMVETFTSACKVFYPVLFVCSNGSLREDPVEWAMRDNGFITMAFIQFAVDGN